MAAIRFENIIADLKKRKGDYWSKVREKKILGLFHSTSKRVPAYKDFLKKHRVDPGKIRTLKDFQLVPATDKDNYVHAYPYGKLFWDGNIKIPMTIHSTSGSTGEPTYFQRKYESDLIREVIIENFFCSNETTMAGPTLFIITFGMGVWSAGLGIYTASYLAGNFKKLPISIIAPGVNKIETLKILKKLAPQFKQVIIAGYPPFVKDIVDDAIEEGIPIKKFNLRFVFTGEAFTEEFRDYMFKKVGIKNIFIDTMNTYGTSELGAVAVESPLTVLGRRLAYENKNIFRGLFGGTIKTPTLAQYIPYFANFECVDGELFLTGDSAVPLVKYRTGDNGGILSYEQFSDTLIENGIDLAKEARKLNISGSITELPLVYVYERKNLAITLYGILIYPEFIKSALFDRRLTGFLTCKFTMIIKYDQRRNQYLELNVELRKGTKAKKTMKKAILDIVIRTLRHKSSEFNELSSHLQRKNFIKIVLWPYEHTKYFSLGNKQKWVGKI